MVRVVVLAVVAANVTTAAADPYAFAPPSSVEPVREPSPEPSFELRLGGSVGNEAVASGYVGTLAFVGGIGIRLGRSPLWFHGQVSAGESLAPSSGDYSTLFITADYLQLQAGFELRTCMHDGQLCLLLGQDAGYQHLGAAPGAGVPAIDTPSDQPLGVTRFGVEGGRDGQSAFRIGIGLDLTETSQRITGGALLLWLGYRFMR